MKIQVNNNKFNFGGNSYNKGDIFDVDGLTGNILIQRNNNLRRYTEKEIKSKSNDKPNSENVST